MDLNNYYEKIINDFLQSPPLEDSLEEAVLSLHESATKLWEAKKQPEKFEIRAANALISIFYIMKELEIKNPEKILQKRLDELSKEKL